MPDPTRSPRETDPRPETDLAVIRRLMEGARQSSEENSAHLVLWGCLLAAAEVFTHLVLTGSVTASLNLVWAVAVGIGVALSALIGRRSWLGAPVNSLVGRILAGIWMGCAAGLMIVGFLGSGTGALSRSAAPGVTAVFFGSAFFASSFLPSKRAYLLLAAVWWALGGALLTWPFAGSRLVLAAALVVFAAVPGLLVRIRGASSARSRAVA